MLGNTCFRLNTKKWKHCLYDYMSVHNKHEMAKQESAKIYLLALRPFPLVEGPVLLLVVGRASQDSEPLLTLLLRHGQLVNVPFHVPGPQEIGLHGGGFFTLNETDGR